MSFTEIQETTKTLSLSLAKLVVLINSIWVCRKCGKRLYPLKLATEAIVYGNKKSAELLHKKVCRHFNKCDFKRLIRSVL